MNIQLLYNNIKPAISLKTQYWLFVKQKTNIVLLLIFFIAGAYGLYQGYVFKNKQTATIAAFKKEKIDKLNTYLKGFEADTTKPEGKEAYSAVSSPLASNWNILLPAFKTPVSTAIFSIGQGDVFPYYYTVKVESFFMQLFKQAEIANSLRSLSGHFDISFWIIYLLPLLIILLCFNTLAAELGNGNWRLINSQGITARRWLSSKFLLTGLFIEILVIAIFISGIGLNYSFFQQSPNINDLLFFVAANLYLLFWLAIIYGINVIGKTTAANALYSGISWVVICIMLPVLTSMIVEKTIPVDNTKISRMSRRPQGSKFDDTTFGVRTIHQLGEQHPLNRNATINPASPGFKLAVYLAYHTLLDDSNTVKVNKYFTQIEQRQTIINNSSLINPAAAIDGMFASLSSNDASANHEFVWQTKNFHSSLNDVYYQTLFFEKLLTKNDYARLPIFNYKPTGISISIVINCLLLLLLSLVIYAVSNQKLKQIS